jgi:HlyD family secretion protein
VALERAAVRAPFDGVVLTLAARPGERVGGAAGLMSFAALDGMVAECEVYETHLRRLAPGQRVELRAAALPAPLAGRVERVGREILRQTLTDASPAANTDSRVARVQVALEGADAEVAARFLGLQVLARFAVDGPAAPAAPR